MTLAAPSRRAFVAGAVATVLAVTAALAGPAQASTETPIQRLFQEWARRYVWLRTTEERHGWTDEEADRLHSDLLDEIEGRIEAQEATGAVDLALKLAALSAFGCVMLSGTHEEELPALLQSGRIIQ